MQSSLHYFGLPRTHLLCVRVSTTTLDYPQHTYNRWVPDLYNGLTLGILVGNGSGRRGDCFNCAHEGVGVQRNLEGRGKKKKKKKKEKGKEDMSKVPTVEWFI